MLLCACGIYISSTIKNKNISSKTIFLLTGMEAFFHLLCYVWWSHQKWSDIFSKLWKLFYKRWTFISRHITDVEFHWDNDKLLGQSPTFFCDIALIYNNVMLILCGFSNVLYQTNGNLWDLLLLLYVFNFAKLQWSIIITAFGFGFKDYFLDWLGCYFSKNWSCIHEWRWETHCVQGYGDWGLA